MKISREYTKEEARNDFLSKVELMVIYWDRVEKETTREKLEGLAFSIMNILDGTSGLPAFDLTILPHEDDKQFCIDEGSNYYQRGMVINDDVMLHDMIFKKRN